MGRNNSKIIELAKGFNNFYFKHLQTPPATTPGYTRLTIPQGNSTPHVVIGLLTPQILENLSPWQPHFILRNKNLEFTPKNPEKRTEIFHEILLDWKEKGLFHLDKTWRGENFEIKPGSHYTSDSTPPLFTLDRSATPLFGLRQFGVHVNGFVRKPSGLSLWLQKRSGNREMWPGFFDNLVGGGLSTKNTIITTATKESSEEASIPSDYLMENLKPAGAVSFFYESNYGLFPNTEFVFDLELSEDFEPSNNDGEVEGFVLVTVEEAMEIVKSSKFKTTSCPVILDFLVRHGFINSFNEPQLPQLLPLLHMPLDMFYTSNHGNY
ncbi:nudix hydrolase 20, chloroplastic isoform X2 [Folsomia candida]|uniref:Nudix hydrolase 20, chloroplastic n=1 Tax=Folsomia candida TaxID=158441 RepID=A0A226DA26_FOLCA|nr:nudix hydrolase 20, chloroplastic isoform X2 [Folsomia candida]OXA41704.1 Nudix hydrolase 20, chloroplastic [Folsomia candida]